MDNKFDAFDNFDPTQEQGTSCGCDGGIYWDMNTQTWRKKATRQPVKPDCSQVEEALKQVQADLTAMTAKAEEQQAELNAKNDALEKANARIAELEAQIADQPTVCEVLKSHLQPVQRLNGEVVYYVVDDVECEDVDTSVSDLSGELVHTAHSQ